MDIVFVSQSNLYSQNQMETIGTRTRDHDVTTMGMPALTASGITSHPRRRSNRKFTHRPRGTGNGP